MDTSNSVTSKGWKVTAVGDRIIRISSPLLSPESPGNSLQKYGFIREPEVAAPQKAERSGATMETTSARISIDDEEHISVTSSIGLPDLRFSLNSPSDGGYTLDWMLDADERLYGLGDQTRERLEHRGHTIRMHVANVVSYIPVPFLVSSRGYGILINTTYSHEWDLGKRTVDRAEIRVPKGAVDFYLFLGADFKSILQEYTSLTGRPVLPPKWSFGLWFICRNRADDREVINDLLNFRDRKIPCDVIGLEPGWMGKEYDYSLDKAWSKERFFMPSYNARHNFISAAKRMGFHLSLWLCQNYDLSHEAERMALKTDPEGGGRNGRLLDRISQDDADGDERLRNAVFSDTLAKPDEPWFDHLRKFVDQGADMFKQDGSLQVNEHPDRLWGNGMVDAEMHNLYPLLYSQQMYEGFRKHTGRRPCCFTAAGWTGLQRYTGTWTGDTGGEAKTLVGCINLAMVAHSLVTCDMEVTTPEGVHYGFLLPWAQVNSWNYFRHPWLLGDIMEPVFRFYASLRSRLLPYLYSYAQVAHASGCPLLRPMVLEFPADKGTFDIKTQWMLGREIMVSCFSKEVYFPLGTHWVDFWTGKIWNGGETITYEPPPGRGGGLFIRGNSILPLGPIRQYTGQQLDDPGMDLHITLLSNLSTEFEIYDDDGISFEYQKGAFRIVKIYAAREGSAVKVEAPDLLILRKIWIHSEGEIEEIALNGIPYKLKKSEVISNTYFWVK